MKFPYCYKCAQLQRVGTRYNGDQKIDVYWCDDHQRYIDGTADTGALQHSDVDFCDLETEWQKIPPKHDN